MTIPSGDAVSLLRQMVTIDSRNPSLVPGGPGEANAAHHLAAVLSEWGMQVELQEAVPGRPNVVARVGSGPGRTLLFNGHIDVVDVQHMTHAPFSDVVRDGQLFSRGASDMKGGVAAMCAAAARAASRGLNGTIIIAAVVDEEFESVGTRALIRAGIRADAAVVTEPTQLAIGPAHRGFTWAEFSVRGRAAHGSRYDVGIDAIMQMNAVLSELHELNSTILPGTTHPLLGHASLHASVIEGGTGWSTYPDLCTLRVERRTMPGETGHDVMQEMERVCAAARQRLPGLDVSVRHVLSQPPSDVAADAAIVRSLEAACTSRGVPARIEGVTAWTDAALLNEAGIPAVCFGPGDMGLAHAAEEWISLDEVEVAAAVLTELALSWCSQ